MYIVGFNGPPECGKDTMAGLLVGYLETRGHTIPVKEVSLSTPLRSIAYSMVGLTYNPAASDEANGYAQFKSTYFQNLGRSGRELMIDASERFLKPTYGESIMARLLLEANAGFSGILLVRDMGFQIEADFLSNRIGARNIYVARVHRDGKTFEGDSRERVAFPHSSDFYNNGTLADLEAEAGKLYSRLTHFMGWSF